jgi:AcrR family transcriptional regulator
MPRVSQQHRDARRDQILSAARRCFLRDGFHATSMQDLFAESGLSAGAVYRYFASKDDVILAIAEDNMHEVLALINQVATADPGRSVGEVVADALALVQAKHEADGVGGTAVLVWSEALRNPELAAQLRTLLTGMLGDFTRLAADHQRAGDLPAGVPADAIARTLVALMAGSILQLTILGPDAVSDITGAVRALWPPAPVS